jgi:hypothetical protein
MPIEIVAHHAVLGLDVADDRPDKLRDASPRGPREVVTRWYYTAVNAKTFAAKSDDGGLQRCPGIVREALRIPLTGHGF